MNNLEWCVFVPSDLLAPSQDKLALLSEIDRSYVGRIERGEVNITLEKAYQLAEVLNCDIRDLLP
uniref:helix-turn-helix domain-containing protein n=1 Tax=Aeromonas caviae TaxID=648 RepID=UPI0035A21D0B